MQFSLSSVRRGCCLSVLLVVAAAPSRGVPPSALEAQLAAFRVDVMRAAPSPRLLVEVPGVLMLAAKFKASGDPARAGEALNLAAIYALLGGDLRQTVTIADRAAAICEPASDHRCVGNAMNQSAIALWRRNDPYAAMRRLDRAARAFRDGGNPGQAAVARLNAANIRHDIGDLDGALGDYDEIDRVYGQDAEWDPTGLLSSKAKVLLKLGGDAMRRAALSPVPWRC